MARIDEIDTLLQKRPVILDGAMGTMIQKLNLNEHDFRGERFAQIATPQSGNNDLLPLTHPEIVERIHYDFLRAGADIIETCTFGANAVSQADYALQGVVAEMNRAAVRTARRAVAHVETEEPGRICLVAGSIGPTNKTASISPDVNDPGYRAIDFDTLCRTYREQVDVFVAEGVDLLLVETIFDTLNAKAALYAIRESLNAAGCEIPIMVSVTVTDKSGRTLSGQTLAAFYQSIRHARPMSVGINCALGAADMFPYLELLHEIADCYVSVYANAGLPNAFGEYEDKPESMAAVYADFARAGLCNIFGGCCGTTPAHIAAIAAAVSDYPVRIPPRLERQSVFTGLEPLIAGGTSDESCSPCAERRGASFIMIGERNNVTGSRKFARLIRDENFEEAIQIARAQVEDGANVIDINMDEAMIDARSMMVRFLNLLAAEPDVARVPVAIDSSEWSVIEAALKSVQGRSIVNSISLKEGEALFKEHARKIQALGAVPIVMAFDEQGQADTTERRVAIAQRAYDILTREIDYEPCDIIFDLNIFPVGTGMDEHRKNALSFMEAARLIKTSMSGVLISGGVSNLSFSFRGNNSVREAMHSVFLYHAIEAGLDMAIVNAGMLEVYDEIDPELLRYVEDVVLDRRDDATERLLEYSQGVVTRDAGVSARELPEWRGGALEERLAHALIKGIPDFLESDLAEAVKVYDSALTIIEGPLMRGMGHVGELFGAGKMFLPQVVKSARSMKKAVEILSPLIEAGSGGAPRKSGKVLFATVKGDVHDIGKNIVSVVLQCNNFEVIDLGVMVERDRILAAAQQHRVDVIALSGLITPSLREMEHLAEEMQRRSMKTPLIVGGATTSPVHTAVKLAPLYGGVVAYARDASIAVPLVQALVTNDANFIAGLKSDQEQARQRFHSAQAAVRLSSYAQVQAKRPQIDFDCKRMPHETGEFVEFVSVKELIDYIDWNFFFISWGMKQRYPQVLEDPEYGERARELLGAAREMLTALDTDPDVCPAAVYAILPAVADGNDLLVKDQRLHFLRRQSPPEFSCLSDFVDTKADHIGLLATTAGQSLARMSTDYQKAGDDFNALMSQLLANRLAEALAEFAHHRVRERWGYENVHSPREMLAGEYAGVRPAVGYPSWPDHSELATVFKLLDVERRIGVSYTESYMMLPESSCCALVLAHPRAHYFDVGRISEDQLADYARRKNIPVEQARALLVKNI